MEKYISLHQQDQTKLKESGSSDCNNNNEDVLIEEECDDLLDILEDDHVSEFEQRRMDLEMEINDIIVLSSMDRKSYDERNEKKNYQRSLVNDSTCIKDPKKRVEEFMQLESDTIKCIKSEGKFGKRIREVLSSRYTNWGECIDIITYLLKDENLSEYAMLLIRKFVIGLITNFKNGDPLNGTNQRNDKGCINEEEYDHNNNDNECPKSI